MDENPLAALEQDYLACIHCGLCTSACPTYVETGQEQLSPRGRIHLIRALAEERTEWTDDVVESLETCLACRACETACPSGVEYGKLIEGAREVVEEQGLRQSSSWPLARFMRDRVLPHRGRLAPLAGLAHLSAALVRRVPVLKSLLPAPAAKALAGIPPRQPGEPWRLPEVIEPLGEERATVIFLPGCVNAVFFAGSNWATVRVLAANGCRVIVPAAAGCCGALHLHTGAADSAREYARHLIEVCEQHQVDAVLTNAAGCGSTLKEYDHQFQHDPSWSRRAGALADSAEDVHRFLARLPWEPPSDGPQRTITYHDACHLAHAQRIRSEPRDLLDAVPGLKRIRLEGSEYCCGSAGLYSMMEPDLAGRLLESKVKSILATGAQVVAAGNSGCIMQIRAGLEAHAAGIEVLHPMEIIDAAYRFAGRYRQRDFR